MKKVALALVGIVMACGGPTKSSSDAGVDAGAQSACGHPGDMGVNSLGVGKYCQTGNDCPSTAPICSTLESEVLMNPNIPPTNFCLVPQCDPCQDPTPTCGANTICACFGPGLCGCAPATCVNIEPPDAGIVCGPDAGPADAGPVDAG